jgi:hypothetical protein
VDAQVRIGPQVLVGQAIAERAYVPYHGREIQTVRWRAGERLQPVGGAGQQGSGTARIAPAHMGEPDRQLGQPPPELAFLRRGGLPHRFQYLVGMEGPVGVEQPLRLRERVTWRQGQIVGHGGLTAYAARQGPPIGVPWPCVARLAPGVPVPVLPHNTNVRHASALWFGVCQPAEQMAVEDPWALLMGEVTGAFDELPAVRGLNVAAGALGAAWQDVRVQRAVQV